MKIQTTRIAMGILAMAFVNSCGLFSDPASELDKYTAGTVLLSTTRHDSLSANAVFCVKLAEAPTAYHWVHSQSESISVVDSATFEGKVDGVTGASVNAAWKFKATRTGEHQIVFKRQHLADSTSVLESKTYTFTTAE